MRLAAVTGLAAEAEIARRAGIEAIAAGGDAARTDAAAERLLAGGAPALVSFGIAGALAPGIASGTLVLPRTVRNEAGEFFSVDLGWHARMRDAIAALGLDVVEGDLVGTAGVVAAIEAKAALHRRAGAVAVDLESHIAAAAAQRWGRPFLALRAIADPASMALPPAALVGIDHAGRAALGPVLRSVLCRPGQVADLVRLAFATRRALAALARVAAALMRSA